MRIVIAPLNSRAELNEITDEEFLETCLAHGKGSIQMISIEYSEPIPLQVSPVLAFVTSLHPDGL